MEDLKDDELAFQRPDGDIAELVYGPADGKCCWVVPEWIVIDSSGRGRAAYPLNAALYLRTNRRTARGFIRFELIKPQLMPQHPMCKCLPD